MVFDRASLNVVFQV